MQFPYALGVPANILYPGDGTAFDMLCRFINAEYVDPALIYIRGMVAELGIAKGGPFAPDAKARALLDQAARDAHHPRYCLSAAAAPKKWWAVVSRRALDQRFTR